MMIISLRLYNSSRITNVRNTLFIIADYILVSDYLTVS